MLEQELKLELKISAMANNKVRELEGKLSVAVKGLESANENLTMAKHDEAWIDAAIENIEQTLATLRGGKE